jgi:hypothetical protein
MFVSVTIGLFFQGCTNSSGAASRPQVAFRVGGAVSESTGLDWQEYNGKRASMHAIENPSIVHLRFANRESLRIEVKQLILHENEGLITYASMSLSKDLTSFPDAIAFTRDCVGRFGLALETSAKKRLGEFLRVDGAPEGAGPLIFQGKVVDSDLVPELSVTRHHHGGYFVVFALTVDRSP